MFTSIEKERKKTSCEATFERPEEWYNTVINAYNVRTDVRTTKFSRLMGYHISLSMEAPLAPSRGGGRSPP